MVTVIRMSKTTISLKLDTADLEAMRAVMARTGINQTDFITDAIREKIEGGGGAAPALANDRPGPKGGKPKKTGIGGHIRPIRLIGFSAREGGGAITDADRGKK